AGDRSAFEQEGRWVGEPDISVERRCVLKRFAMFNRDNKQARVDTLIGKASRVHGDLEFAGGLHLDGSIAGNVRADPSEDSSLSISETGSIEGNVESENVMLNGTVRGDILA